MSINFNNNYNSIMNLASGSLYKKIDLNDSSLNLYDLNGKGRGDRFIVTTKHEKSKPTSVNIDKNDGQPSLLEIVTDLFGSVFPSKQTSSN